MTRRAPAIVPVRIRASRPGGAALALAACLALAFMLAACGSGAATPAPPSSPGVSRVEGLVTDIVTSGPVGVASFTIRTNDGATMEFAVGTLDLTGGGFPAEHLSEHRLASEPVTVYYRDDGATHVAVKLTDVVASPSPS